jgi:iron complex outermembrane receptor protein
VLGKALDGKLDYIIGGYYFREHGDGVTSNFVPLSVATSRRLAQGNPANESKAIFGQATFRPTPTLSITGGLRQTWDHREQNLRTATPTKLVSRWDGLILADGGANANCSLTGDATHPVTNTPTGCLISAQADFHQLTYTASIDWKPTPDTLVYAITRKGYRSGGFNQSVTAAVNVVEPFRPESVTDIEIGFKGNWRWDNGMAAGLNIAAYRDKYKDIQRGATTVVGSRTVTINAANATIKGLEVEARFEPTPWLELSGFYSLIDAKFQNFEIPNNGLFRDAGLYPNAEFSGVPTDSGGATITLHTELPNNMGRIAASMDYYGQTGSWLQDNNARAATIVGGTVVPGPLIIADYSPGYWLLGANISWTGVMGKPVDLNFNVRNLNNKVYYTGGVDGSTSGIGTVSYYVGEPRLYTFNLTYHF